MADSVDREVALTKDYIRQAFAYLEEVHDLDKRNVFFKQYMIDNVTWEISGRDHRLAGTRYTQADHTAASFARCREKLIGPIKFVVRNIILDHEDRSACIELYGYATQLDGEPYDNDYSWTTTWNSKGQITFVRSYHDTNLAEILLDK